MSAAVERRKASALRSARGCAPLSTAMVGAPFRRSASPYFIGGKSFVALVCKTRARLRRENEIARTIRPREAGEGDHWSSRSERTVVEGAPDSQLRYRRREITAATLFRFTRKEASKLNVSARRQPSCNVEACAPSTALRAVPLPRYRGGG